MLCLLCLPTLPPAPLTAALPYPQDYPDHRLRFFSFLRAIATRCFRALFSLSPAHLKLVMDSIIWAIRHTERNVADTGLLLLSDLVNSFSESEFNNQFAQGYYLSLVQEIFAVLTDTFHKPGFKLHALILQARFFFHFVLSFWVRCGACWVLGSHGGCACACVRPSGGGCGGGW